MCFDFLSWEVLIKIVQMAIELIISAHISCKRRLWEYSQQNQTIWHANCSPDIELWYEVCAAKTSFKIFVVVISKDGLSGETQWSHLLVWHWLTSNKFQGEGYPCRKNNFSHQRCLCGLVLAFKHQMAPLPYACAMQVTHSLLSVSVSKSHCLYYCHALRKKREPK